MSEPKIAFVRRGDSGHPNLHKYDMVAVGLPDGMASILHTAVYRMAQQERAQFDNGGTSGYGAACEALEPLLWNAMREAGMR